MKKCIVLSDSFKGTLSSLESCSITRDSISKFFPQYQVATVPVADGGEGAVECFAQAIGDVRCLCLLQDLMWLGIKMRMMNGEFNTCLAPLWI